MDVPKLRIMAIGAHPDDCEYRCGGMAALWAARGHEICFVSLTNGQSGHHELPPAQLVSRRIAEASKAAAVIGIESRVMDNPDGHLEPTLENRLTLIRLIRAFRPDLLITNRPNDYHPDHRYTAQLLQDSVFLLTVPHVAPEAPALRRVPVVLYWFDSFRKPAAFSADAAIDVASVIDKKFAMLHQHASQFYEWLPWLDGRLDEVPPDEPSRLAWLRRLYTSHNPIADACRDRLMARYGPQRGGRIEHAEAFEACEYGAPLDTPAMERFFGGL